MPRILSRTPIDYHRWQAGRVTVRPPGPLDYAEDAAIEDGELRFEVVKWMTGWRDKNAAVMNDCEEYCLARLAD